MVGLTLSPHKRQVGECEVAMRFGAEVTFWVILTQKQILLMGGGIFLCNPLKDPTGAGHLKGASTHQTTFRWNRISQHWLANTALQIQPPNLPYWTKPIIFLSAYLYLQPSSQLFTFWCSYWPSDAHIYVVNSTWYKDNVMLCHHVKTQVVLWTYSGVW